MHVKKILTLVLILVAIVCLSGLFTVAIAQVSRQQNFPAPTAKFSKAIAFDVSAPLRDLAAARKIAKSAFPEEREIRPERVKWPRNSKHSADKALQAGGLRPSGSLAIPPPSLTFEGLSNQDNFETFGFRVAPPDPVGDVGPNHYVEMINLVFAVYDKTGHRLLGPVDTGTLWADFAVPDCTDPSGDPVVLYDQFADRWLLSQFTTRGPIYYNCVAISQTGDPTGAYFRYAFSAGPFFPDYPKYGVWKKSYILTSRDFGNAGEYGISAYALERAKMLKGNPKARAVHFFLDSAVVPLNLIGDGLLPADIDGSRVPTGTAPAPLVGTQDDDIPYGATFDALNIWDCRWYGCRLPWLPSRSEDHLELPHLIQTSPAGSRRLSAARCSRLPARARSNGWQPVPGHLVLSATADVAPRLSQIWSLRVAGDQPVRRGAARRRRCALV